MDSNQLVTAYTLHDVNQAEVIRLALEDAGIPCQIGGGRTQLGFTGVAKVEILVRAAALANARDLIRSHAVDHPPSAEALDAMHAAEPDDGGDEEGIEIEEE